jgi:hypothetical protein
MWCGTFYTHSREVVPSVNSHKCNVVNRSRHAPKKKTKKKTLSMHLALPRVTVATVVKLLAPTVQPLLLASYVHDSRQSRSTR